MSKSRPLALVVATLIAATAASSALADARATLNRSKVAMGDTFGLTITADGPAANAQPDLGVLAQSFDVLGTSQSMQTSIINGLTTTSRGWTVHLAPKSEGNLTIPAIQVGPDTTAPLTIEVVKVSDLPRADMASDGLQLEVSAPPGPHYVNEEFPVTVRILDGIGLNQASLTELSSPDFTIKQAGQDRASQATYGGKPANVIERTYLVTPLKSGDLTLPPLVLRGTVADPNGARSPFGNVFGGRDPFAGMPTMGGSIFNDMFNPGKPVEARSDALRFHIEAAAPGQAGTWFLPASDVALKAAWDPANPTWKAGESVTRIVQIVALGASKEKLPDLEFTSTQDMRIYVDRVDDRTETTVDGSAAIKQFTLSIVPEHGGTMTIPEVRVNWFDTTTRKNAVATLLAETIEVAGPPAATPTASAASPAPQAAKPTVQQGDTGFSAVAYLSVAAALLALLGWLGLRYARGRATRPRDADSHKPALAADGARRKQAVETAARDVLDACRANDPAQTSQALQVFATLTGTDLHALTGEAGACLASEISAMETVLFGFSDPSGQAWRGAALAKAFAAWRKTARDGGHIPTTGDLPPLYQAVN